MTQENARGPWLVPLLAGLAAAAVGLGAGWYLRGTSGAEHAGASPLEVQAAPGVTREELEGMKREILAHLESLARSRPASSSAAPLPANDAVIELGRRLDELDARIALLSTGVRPGIGGRAWANARGQGSESIEKISARIVEANTRARKDEPHEDVAEALTREHFLWTLEDVVRTYGPPQHLDTTNGLMLFFDRFSLEGTEEPCCVEFILNAGFVTQVDWECRKGW